MRFQFSDADIRRLIPNVIHAVQGESSLLAKLSPGIASQSEWLSGRILGPALVLPENSPAFRAAEALVVYRAFADLVPSLDLVLSPAGFAVISSQDRVPASRDRVERLIASYRSMAGDALCRLFDALFRLPQWISSSIGEFWISSSLASPADVAGVLPKDRDLFEFFCSCRSTVAEFDRIARRDVLGPDLMAAILSVPVTGNPDPGHLAAHAALRDIARDFAAVIPLQHRAAVLARLQQFADSLEFLAPGLFRLWKDSFSPASDEFTNSTKGAFWF